MARELVPPKARGWLERSLLGPRARVAETLEELHLLLAVTAHGMVFREVAYESANTGPKLEREVRRRGPDERVDVLFGRLAHRREP